MAEKHLILDMPVRMNECGPDGYLRSNIWFDYLQHMAAEHAERLGFGLSAVKERNLIWVLSRIKVQMDAYPRFDDILRIETYHNGFEKLFAKRQFIVTSAKTGERFGVGSSCWLTVDTTTMRLKPPVKMLNGELNENLDREDFFPVLDKLAAPGELEMEQCHQVLSSHIDLNNHLNNTYYGEYTLDWLSAKLGRFVRFKDIQINYNQAMLLNGELAVRGKLTADNGFYVEGTDCAGGKNSFQASGSYEFCPAML